MERIKKIFGNEEDKIKKYALETRKNKPDKIPVLVSVPKNSNIHLQKTKYVVPKNLTVKEFMNVLRKHINLHKEEALFLFINNRLEPIFKTFREIDDEEKPYIHIVLNKENTFG